ncbi:hypothetical protein [Fodinicola feengrottensis]|uniref:hypothetical protein n=1 Tax=Fodinicola feengrottensis TaxID=435914 RepID=UPI002440F43E|nr:hypothetical protein [Fodinicola feengrottensis]
MPPRQQTSSFEQRQRLPIGWLVILVGVICVLSLLGCAQGAKSVTSVARALGVGGQQGVLTVASHRTISSGHGSRSAAVGTVHLADGTALPGVLLDDGAQHALGDTVSVAMIGNSEAVPRSFSYALTALAGVFVWIAAIWAALWLAVYLCTYGKTSLLATYRKRVMIAGFVVLGLLAVGSLAAGFVVNFRPI